VVISDPTTPLIVNLALSIWSAGVPETVNLTTSPAVRADFCTSVKGFQLASYILTAVHAAVGPGVGVLPGEDVVVGVGFGKFIGSSHDVLADWLTKAILP